MILRSRPPLAGSPIWPSSSHPGSDPTTTVSDLTALRDRSDERGHHSSWHDLLVLPRFTCWPAAGCEIPIGDWFLTFPSRAAVRFSCSRHSVQNCKALPPICGDFQDAGLMSRYRTLSRIIREVHRHSSARRTSPNRRLLRARGHGAEHLMGREAIEMLHLAPRSDISQWKSNHSSGLDSERSRTGNSNLAQSTLYFSSPSSWRTVSMGFAIAITAPVSFGSQWMCAGQ